MRCATPRRARLRRKHQLPRPLQLQLQRHAYSNAIADRYAKTKFVTNSKHVAHHRALAFQHPASLPVTAPSARTVSTSVVNPNAATTVGYALSGKAIFGIHYNVSGIPGQVTIPAGSSSSSFTLTAIPNGPSNGRNMVAKMALQKGLGYRLSAAKKASVTIVEPPSHAYAHTDADPLRSDSCPG